MRLLLVELTRFRSRRAIALMLLAAALLTAALAASAVYDTRPVSGEDRAAAQAQADRDAARPRVQREVELCEADPERFFGPGTEAALCAEEIVPSIEWYLFRQPLSLGEQRGDAGLAIVLIVAALMTIVGSTFAGADWASGSVSNQVLFEPRRLKVWAAKAVAVFTATLLASAVILTAFWITLYIVAQIRGIDTGAAVQSDLRWMIARGALLTAAGATGGYALTMLVRHTVGTLAVLFAYAVGGEALTAALPIQGAGRWSLANNVFAFVQDGHRYYDYSMPCGPGRNGCDQSVLLTLTDGATYLGPLLLVVMLLSAVSFWRRDIP